MNQQKRMLAINDISCFGKCSLAVATPILSAAGIETCMLPTAVLSAHTAFPGFTFRDLTEDMLAQASHWQKLGLQFHGIYSGYLGSIRQVAYVEEIVKRFPAEFVLVDPVMGDNGKLYTGFDAAYITEMRRLLSLADAIAPNVTEAAFLADVPYEAGIHSTEYIETVIHNLKSYTKKDIVITGIHTRGNTIGTAVYTEGKFHMIEREKCHVEYSGTGDVFASVLAAAVLNGMDIVAACTKASDFTTACIVKTQETSPDRAYGLNFELCIGNLLKELHIN